MSGEVSALMGISTKVLVGGAVGAAIGSVLGTGTWWERTLRGVAGMAAAYVGHHVTAIIAVGIVDIFLDAPNLPTVAEMEPVAAFIIGLVGMVACQMGINLVTAARDHVDDYVEHKLDKD